jgi:hypothetical protein
MALAITTALRNAHLNNIRDAIDAGAGPGVVRIYAGTRPASGGAATTLLGTCTFSATSAADASGGVLTFNAITEDSSADATGTATWARAEDSTGTWVMDMDVGTSGSGASLILNTTSIVEGGPIRIDSGTLTAGNA